MRPVVDQDALDPAQTQSFHAPVASPTLSTPTTPRRTPNALSSPGVAISPLSQTQSQSLAPQPNSISPTTSLGTRRSLGNIQTSIPIAGPSCPNRYPYQRSGSSSSFSPSSSTSPRASPFPHEQRQGEAPCAPEEGYAFPGPCARPSSSASSATLSQPLAQTSDMATATGMERGGSNAGRTSGTGVVFDAPSSNRMEAAPSSTGRKSFGNSSQYQHQPQRQLSAQQRLSFTERPRRPSPLMHEIQPPARRLSAHQVLLLTPFGGALPLTMTGGMDGMRRVSSSMGYGGVGGGANTRRSSGASARRSVVGNTPSGMERTGQSSTSPMSSQGSGPPRTRHSLATSTAIPGPSPLAVSQPLTTIVSGSDPSSSTPSSVQVSRDPSRDDDYGNQDGNDSTLLAEIQAASNADLPDLELIALTVSGTVAMTRSNSLPVLTLRELEAMKEKDGELGIERGGDWAWVSRGEEDDHGHLDMEEQGQDRDPERIPALDDLSATASSASLLSATTPPLETSRMQFSDPFAPASASVPHNSETAPRTPLRTPLRGDTFRRTEETSRFGGYRPVATAEGYVYSPGQSEPRRMSEVPVGSASTTVASSNRDVSGLTAAGGASARKMDNRRPSAPTLSARAAERTPPQTTGLRRAPGLESPRGTPLPSLPRPRILRYKTSPARYTGLGLSIVVNSRSDGVGPAPAPGTGSAGPSSAGTSGSAASASRRQSLGGPLTTSSSAANAGAEEALSTVERRERRHARLRAKARVSGTTPAPDAEEGQAGETRNSDTETQGQQPISAMSTVTLPERARFGSWARVDILDGLEAEAIALPPDIERRLSERTGSVSSVSSRGSISGINWGSALGSSDSIGTNVSGIPGRSRGSVTSISSASAVPSVGAGTSHPYGQSNANRRGSSRSVVLLETTRGMSLAEFGYGPSSTDIRRQSRGDGGGARFDAFDQGTQSRISPAADGQTTRITSGPHDDFKSSWDRPYGSLRERSTKSSLVDSLEAFPRRGSLAVLTQLENLSLGGGVVGLWAKRFGSVGSSGSAGRDNEKSGEGREWYERRGSWAEGWETGRDGLVRRDREGHGQGQRERERDRSVG